MTAKARWALARAWMHAHPYRTAAGLYLLLAGIFVHDWDGYVFATAVEGLWHGQSPYTVALDDPWYGYLNVADQHVQWYAYPPLPLLLMAVTALPSLLAPLPPFLDRILIKLPMIAGTLALAWVAGGWAQRLSNADDRDRIARRFLFNPFLILVGVVWGMTDTLLMALYMGGLLAVANGRRDLGGLLVGLSILVKPFPALLLLPVVPFLIGRDGWAATTRFGTVVAATVATVCIPFAIAEPVGFWRQSVGAHLARDPQGLTLWALWPLDQLPNTAISILSLLIMAAGLLAVGVAATRLRGRGTSLVLTLAAAIAILVANRVVNEQYLVLVVAPMLVLDVVHRLDRFGHILTRWTPTLFAAAIALVGFHFVTFLPPDVANILFWGTPTDHVAFLLRRPAPWAWAILFWLFEVAVPLTIVALAVLAARLVRQRMAEAPLPAPSARRALGPTAAACLLLALLGLTPLLGSAAAEEAPFEAAYDEPQVAAFYYLWWQNPAHDPDVLYGNWPVVSQHPEMGYYTNTRGVAREHVGMMVDNGIDTAIVSYHRGELQRYDVFQEEAAKQGLWVTPLIELNQVYDQAQHHPVDQNGVSVPYAAYRLDADTRRAIEQFVVDLRDGLAQPSALRLDGRPVVMFYDSYVSGVSFHPEDRRALAETLLGMMPIEDLRREFRDPTMPATADGVLAHHPTIMTGFYDPGSAALWRRAHLEAHKQFWIELRAELEAELGPLYLVSGDALNERAGFDAGTVKALVGLEVFDAAFIYSPSFTFGNQPKAPFNDTFALWEDRNHWLTSFARTVGAGSSFGIAPAYDDTVNRPHGFVIPAFPPGHERTFYDLSWDSTHDEPPTLAGVATFNEWFEGSSVEPSREYGDRFLEQTLLERQRLEAGPGDVRDVVVVLHERSSRTSLDYSETDLTHFWGLDLLAAAPRAVPQAQVSGLDALEPRVADADLPDLILVEGGRGQFEASATVLTRLHGWAGVVPHIVFGPDVALPLDPVLGDNCLVGLDDVPDPKTLVPGDTLGAQSGVLELVRDGVHYDVGRACEAGLRAGTSVKPWVGTDPTMQTWGGAYDALNAHCLQVVLGALLPEFAPTDAPTSCTVPQPPAGLLRAMA